jgi:Putative F0F1-ATPase subunit Ca2+/Mg2+ transporter
MPGGPPDRKEMGYYLALAQVGVEMVAPIGLGLALDLWLGWLPVATFIGLVVGFGGGLYHLVTMVRQHDAEERRGPPGEAP